MTDHSITVTPATDDGRAMWLARCPCSWRSIRCVSEFQAKQIGDVHVVEMARMQREWDEQARQRGGRGGRGA
jgi:hypothetical protein